MWTESLSILLLLLAGSEAVPANRLAVIRPAPDFQLINQEEQPLRLADLRGRVVLVGFIFTRCSGTCPATTHRMSLIQQELQRRGLFKDNRVKLVSISLDPDRDTPVVLRQYARMYDADLKTWSFLTGPPATVKKVIPAWDMWVKPAENGQLDHPSRIFLLDRQHRIREIYNLGFLQTGWVCEDIELLLKE